MKNLRIIVALVACCLMPLFAGCEKKHEHSLELISAVASTCENEGSCAYYKCSGCLKLFDNEFAEKEITLESTVVDALGHEYTEDSGGILCKKICNRCSNEKFEHKLKFVNKIDSSCESEGVESHYVCEICDKLFNNDVAESELSKESLVIEEKGHDYVKDENGEECNRICSRCGERKDEHVYSNEVNALLLSHESIDNCGVFKCLYCENVEYRTITSSDIGVPILNFYGSMDGISKENKITLSVRYESQAIEFWSDATLKWQGASSLNYPKKNYNITFLKTGTTSKNKVLLNDSWGKQSKYTLKANWIDFSHARNVVSGKIYKDIVKSNKVQDELSTISTGGVVDGFPIVIYINGRFEGLYTLNIPKDGWMFGMEDDEDGGDVLKQAALSMGAWGDEVCLKKEIDGFSDDVELEFCSTEDTIGNEWVLQSFNNMIRFVNNSSDEEFKANISNYINVDRTIDAIIYTSFIMAADNTAKNINWLTYDGIHWFSSMYDMDATWGLWWDGKMINRPVGSFLDEYCLDEYCGNLLWNRIYTLLKDDIVRRYFELRLTVMTYENIKYEFEAFSDNISSIIREVEIERWGNIPSVQENNIQQILDFAVKRLNYMDNRMLEEI